MPNVSWSIKFHWDKQGSCRISGGRVTISEPNPLPTPDLRQLAGFLAAFTSALVMSGLSLGPKLSNSHDMTVSAKR